MPQSGDLDVTAVELGQVLHASELSLPDKVKILHQPNEVSLSVHLEKVKEEETTEDEELAEGETEATADVATEEDSDKKDDSTKKED